MARSPLFGILAIALLTATPLSVHALPASTVAQRSPAEINAQRRWEADQERARQMELDRQERQRQREAERLRQEEREAERLEWQRQNDDWRENREDQWDDWEDDWRDRHRDGDNRYHNRDDDDRFDCGDRWSEGGNRRDCEDNRYYWYDRYDQYDQSDRYDNDSYLYYDSPDYTDNWQQVNETVPVTFTAIGRDWTMISIQGRTINQELSFTGGSQQTVSLIPGTYYLRFRDTYSPSYWEIGYLIVDAGDRVTVQFDSDRNWISVDDGSWQSERAQSPGGFDWPTYP
jgi:hypothetical protein